MDKTLLSFCQNLKELRLQHKYTQKQVAEKIGITYQSYQHYEMGLGFPSIPNLVKIADLFDVSIDEMLGRKVY